MNVIINPGTGPIADATLERAIACAHQLREDIGNVAVRPASKPIVLGATFGRAPFRDSDGRYGFMFRYRDREVPIDMPGLPIDRVRFLGLPGQNAIDFPRLYIDDHSFLWCYVVELLRAALLGLDEE